MFLLEVFDFQVYNCTKLIHGAALQKGYDSHTSPDKHELVIFNTYHILPQYIVHYKSGAAGEFTYTVIKGNNIRWFYGSIFSYFLNFYFLLCF